MEGDDDPNSGVDVRALHAADTTVSLGVPSPTPTPISSMTSARRRIWRWSARDGVRRIEDELAVEEPLEIQIESRAWSVTMRTPGHDEELAAGFLLGEGIVRSRQDIQDIRHYPRNQKGNVVNVFLDTSLIADPSRLTRNVFMSSSCGLCGKASIEAVHAHFKPLRSKATLDARVLLSLQKKMRDAQSTFEKTGGLHAAALFDLQGNLIVLREDIGRHNAVDKVIGHALLHRPTPLTDSILMVSGRASFEILQKALGARVPFIAAVSAPSTLAAEFAQSNRQTLIGFLREDRFNIYAGRSRLRRLPR